VVTEGKFGESEGGGVNRLRASVIVCTRERPQELSRCLRSVMSQQVDFPFEVIVVDNAPVTALTQQLVSDFGDSVRYVVEPRKGLDFARNRGIAQSAAPVVVFLDDDAVADPTWLAQIVEPFGDDAVGCVTGLNKPSEMETRAQELFEKHQGLGRGEQPRVFDRDWGKPYFPLGSGIVGAGCNSAFRRDALMAIGSFEESLDVGTPSRGGGDLYAFYRIIRAGYKIAYQPTAVIHHRHRRSMRELRKTMFDYGAGHSAYQLRCLLSDRDPVALVFPIMWFFSYHLREVARSIIRRSGMPVSFAALQTIGYLYGPLAYVASVIVISRRRRLTREAV
jgi:O-antigen biosynthesis protein